MSDGRLAAFGVHSFTALGVVLGFQALLETVAHHWESAFAWLGAALLVDAIDGPLARRVGVSNKLPRFSGEQLDLIIDYLTYVLIPAFILYEAQLMPAGLGWFGASLVLLSSLFHFCDHESKTKDGFFVGFPALWNVVVLYMLVLGTSTTLNLVFIAMLFVLTFIPLKWVHPVRSIYMRSWTLPVVAVWSLSAIFALVEGFPSSFIPQAIFVVSMVYFVAVGLLRSSRDEVTSNLHSSSDTG